MLSDLDLAEGLYERCGPILKKRIASELLNKSQQELDNNRIIMFIRLF